MDDRRTEPVSLGRLYATYAAISLVPVVLLGIVLAWSYGGEAQRRGLAEGRSEAGLVAQTAVAPQLDDRPLANGLNPAERARLYQVVGRSVGSGDVLRFRLRDLTGQVVYSDDGSGFGGVIEDEVLDAARGETVALLTHLNTDRNDQGRPGPAAVEVYMPLRIEAHAAPIGVLEIYLPYKPIQQDITAGLHGLYTDLAIGLVLLYVVLLVIVSSSSRRLRRSVRLNGYLAEHDILTQLPNRALFHRRCAAAVEAAQRTDVALAVIDLDRFKDVNDALGHHHGDELLQLLARRLADVVGPDDTIARLGGDEFGLVLTNCSDPERELRKVRDVLGAEIEVRSLPFSVDASIGYVVVPEDGTDVTTLMQRADVAMYHAKTHHLGIVRYDDSQNHYGATDLELIGQLRHAIADSQLVLHYQPKVSLGDGTISAFEALVRWNHPTLGLLGPDKFIPLAEQTDLIDALTRWVLTTAMTQIVGLGPAWGEVAIAVNVSARSLNRPEFAGQVTELIRHAGLPPNRLIIEITETTLLTEPDQTAAILSELAGLGVRVSIDDFGKGQTSLGYLAQLPVHELKIDKSFVMDMLANPAHAAIVRSIIDLGHNLGMHVVAEGIESEHILVGLQRAGCDVAQGYFLGRPAELHAVAGAQPARLIHASAADAGSAHRGQVSPEAQTAMV
jgi:diguanylate cyclase